MKNKILIFILFLVNNPAVYALPLPKELPAINSRVGESRFKEAELKRDFFATIPYAVTQQKPTYCGVASSVIVLNALNLEAPVDERVPPYKLFTQDNVFKAIGEDGTPRQSNVLKKGMNIQALQHLLTANGANVKAIYANEVTYKAFMKDALSTLREDKHYLIVNYYRPSLALPGGGHLSPVVAYDENTDAFLLLEVSRYKYPPFWVKSKALWDAINTLDGKISRGYVIVTL